jgi:GNAT superfamily N-acetyltransferase
VLHTTPTFGQDAAEWLAAVAELRIAVFREFPYLYEGSLESERRYLATYAASPHAVVVITRDGDRVVGAATAMPLTAHSDDVEPPLRAAGYDPARVYYFGESVLLPAYRGRGIGNLYFDHREAAARRFGFSTATFCAVVRPADHPLRPADYAPHDAFWTKRGFTRRPDVTCTFSWRDLDQPTETEKAMVFWTKELTEALPEAMPEAIAEELT